MILAADVLDLLDSTITNIAAPTIAGDLGGGPALVQWLGASYALALGVLLVPGGRLGDRYGRRRVFLVGLAGFVVASLACGLAPGPVLLVVARLVQGAFGALLIPQGFGILGASWPRDQLGKAFSLFGPVMGLSAVGGPILAGFLVDADLGGLGWRPMFLINLLLGGAALLAALRLLPHDTGDGTARVDGPGSALIAGAMLCLLGGIIYGSDGGTPPGEAGPDPRSPSRSSASPCSPGSATASGPRPNRSSAPPSSATAASPRASSSASSPSPPSPDSSTSSPSTSSRASAAPPRAPPSVSSRSRPASSSPRSPATGSSTATAAASPPPAC